MKFYEIQNLYVENISKEALIQICELDNLIYYGIVHDKDKLPGSCDYKKAHFHLIVGIDDNSRNAIDTVRNIFQGLTKRVIAIRSLQKMCRYLTHKDNKEKYQYNDDDVFTNDIESYLSYIELTLNPSKIDLLLESYLSYIQSMYNKGLIIEYFDIMIWFKQQGKLSYFMQHKNNIEDFTQNVLNGLDKGLYL